MVFSAEEAAVDLKLLIRQVLEVAVVKVEELRLVLFQPTLVFLCIIILVVL